MNHAQRIAIIASFRDSYEADAFRADLRADAADAAGLDDAAKAQHTESDVAAKMQQRMADRLTSAIADAEKDGYVVTFSDDGSTVQCERPGATEDTPTPPVP